MYWLRSQDVIERDMPAPENAAGQQEAEIIQVPVNPPAEVMAPLNVPIVPAPQGPPPGFPVQRYNVNIELFTGKGNVTALEWWTMFVTFVTLQRMPEADALLVFPFHLAGVAKAWFNTLDTQTKSTFNNLKAAFLQRFKPTLNAGVKITELRQYAYETVDEYIDRALSLNSNNCVSEEFLISVTEKGFKKGMGHIILPNRSKTMHALREIANVAEMTIAVSGQPQMEDITSTINQAVCSAVKSVEANMLDSIMTRMDTTLSAMNRPDRRPDYRPEQHRVKFNTQQNHQYSTKSDECGYCGGNFGLGQRVFIYTIMMVIFCGVSVGAMTAKETDIVQRINYGVIFKEETKLYLAKESWLHTFKVSLPEHFSLPNISFCNENSTQCDYFNSIINFVRHLQDTTKIHLIESIRSIKTLIPQNDILLKKRNARSFLPFIGSLAKGLFGTATMGDVNLLASHINQINQRTRLMARALEQHGDHLSSFMSLVDKRTTNLMDGIQQNSVEILAIANKFQMSLENTQSFFLNTTTLLTELTNKGNMLRSKVDQFQAAIQSLVEGRISPFLLPKHTLTLALHKIQTILTNSYPGFYLTQPHPSYYYTNSNFMFMRNHSKLFITLRFPISSLTHPLRLYKILSLPVPVNNSLKHATKLLDLPDFFAITHQHDYYLHISANELSNCKHESIVTCNFNKALIPTHVPQCTIGLFNNDINQVSQFCDFRFLKNHLTHDIIELSSTSVLVYQSDSLALNCPGKQTTLPGCKFCVIQLPCKCSLSTVSLYLPPRLVNCYNKTSELSVFHPINLAVLQEFFNQNKLKTILGDSLFSNQISMTIPNFKFYTHNMSNILAADHEVHLSLKKMSAAARNDSLIFKSLTEPLLYGQIKLQSEWPDLNAILIFVAIGIASVTFLFFIFMFLKFRRMATAILVLQQVVKSKSDSVPSFIYHKVTATPAPNDISILEKFITSEFTWLHASVILSCLVLVLLSVLVYFLYRRRNSKCTRVYLEITSGGDCVTIPIINLSLCPSYYDFSTPSVQNITISALPYSKLFFLCSSFVITNKLTMKTVQIPDSVSIGYLTRRRLNKILMQSFNAYVLVTHQRFATVLNPASFGS
ncbi:uncharacterized protein LOC134695439 isoform X1 [Mytilus trossulus]|uniref:uncharacterized protein LOC134695439 isoform X1 n=1 Tax=Mytilus trossulus TaxID=6551 RepID=UPI003003C1E8